MTQHHPGDVPPIAPMRSGIRLLHISDIHFAGYWDGAPGADYEVAVRDKMLSDFGYMREQLGAMDGILLVGDVANWGKPAEYAKAVQFLDAAAELVGCPPERIVCVPGNHDVDRYLQTPTHGLLRRHLRSVHPDQVNDELRQSFKDEALRAALLAPFAAYNEFAFAYGCHFDTPDLVFAPKTFDFGALTLHVMGINSSWICDGSEQADHPTDSLVAGTFQALEVPDDPTVVSVALCHHPANWLRDGKEITSWMNNAHLVLTGHEHVAGITQGLGGMPLKVAAGAVNPTRGEPGWLPAYNVIELQHEPGENEITVTIHARSWAVEGPARFDQHVGLAGGPSVYRIPLARPRTPVRSTSDKPVKTENPPLLSAPSVASPLVDVQAEPIESAKQSHVRTIMRAPTDARRTQARQMGLVEEGDPEDRSVDRLIVQRAIAKRMTAALAASLLERMLGA